MTSSEWKQVCEDFADKVKAKQYKKWDYNLWCKWCKSPRNDISVAYHYHDCEDAIELWNTETGESIKLPTLDKSFGEYLYDMCFSFHKRGEKDMGTETYTAAIANNTINASAITGGSIDGITVNGCLASNSTHDKISNALKSISNISLNDIVTPGTYADYGAKADKAEVNCLEERIVDLEKILKNNKEKEEEKKMKGFNFDFGKITGDSVRMSVYGVAVKNNSGTWVAYDSKTESMMDVDVLNFSGADMLYKMPVAVNQVQAGDVIIHNRKPCFVVSFSEDGSAFSVVDIMDSEQKMILPVKSPFGFSFVTKVVSPFNLAGSADAQNPFGNMLPLMMMGDKDIDPMMLMMMCGNGGFDMSNPMMMMFLLDDKGDKSDMMKTMLMAQMFANQNK